MYVKFSTGKWLTLSMCICHSFFTSRVELHAVFTIMLRYLNYTIIELGERCYCNKIHVAKTDLSTSPLTFYSCADLLLLWAENFYTAWRLSGTLKVFVICIRKLQFAATIQCERVYFSYCGVAHPRSLEGTLLGIINILQCSCVRTLYEQRCKFFSRDMIAFFVNITRHGAYSTQIFKQKLSTD
jgi:hypothetical protein